MTTIVGAINQNEMAIDLAEHTDGNDSAGDNDDETEEQFILRHTNADHRDDAVCSDASGCFSCSIRDCPYGAIEHYWHDGCPSCTEAADESRKQAVNAERK